MLGLWKGVEEQLRRTEVPLATLMGKAVLSFPRENVSIVDNEREQRIQSTLYMTQSDSRIQEAIEGSPKSFWTGVVSVP